MEIHKMRLTFASGNDECEEFKRLKRQSLFFQNSFLQSLSNRSPVPLQCHSNVTPMQVQSIDWQ